MINNNQKTILLMGQTGSGKSSFGNFLLGRRAFVTSNKCNSCTTKTVKETSSNDKLIDVIDTPGLSDSEGRDQAHTQQMLDFVKDLHDNRNKINLILIVINFYNKRLDEQVKNMVLFLCNAFPINLSRHIGIVFTNYIDEDERENNNGEDPRIPSQEEYVPTIMKIISDNNHEELNLDPYMFFVDSYEDDRNSREELKRIINLTKSLSPIETVHICDVKYKSVEDVFDTETREEEEDDQIVTIKTTYRTLKYTDYNGVVTYGKREQYGVDKNYKKKELPKLKEESFKDKVSNYLLDVGHTYRSMVEVGKINKESGYSLSALEKMFLLVVGYNTSKYEWEEKQKNKNK